MNYWARYDQERQIYSLYREYHSYILCSYIFAIRIELLYIRTNEVRENINSVYITCKNSIEQSRVESKHIFSGFSRKENMFVYFLFIQLNGIFSIFKRELIQLSKFVFNPYGISWTLWSQYMYTSIVNNTCIKKKCTSIVMFSPQKNYEYDFFSVLLWSFNEIVFLFKES